MRKQETAKSRLLFPQKSSIMDVSFNLMHTSGVIMLRVCNFGSITQSFET